MRRMQVAGATTLTVAVLAATAIADDAGWVLANRGSTSSAVLEEWLRPGDRLDNWREMVSRLEVREISSPLSIATDTRSRVRTKCPDVQWTWHRQLPDDVLYEFDSGVCRDGSGPEREIARLTPLPGNRTFKVSWSARGYIDAATRAYWRDVLDGPFGRGDERSGSPPAGPRGNTIAGRIATPEADTRTLASGDSEIDTDAEMARCKQSERPFECMADVQERLLRSMSAPSATSATVKSKAKAERQPGALRGTGVRRLSLHEGRPDGGPRAEEVTGFKSTSGQFYAVAHYDGEQGGRQITFEWHYLSGDQGAQQISRRQMTVERGATSAVSVLTFQALIPVGRYRVDVYMDDELAAQVEFDVVRAGIFG